MLSYGSIQAPAKLENVEFCEGQEERLLPRINGKANMSWLLSRHFMIKVIKTAKFSTHAFAPEFFCKICFKALRVLWMLRAPEDCGNCLITPSWGQDNWRAAGAGLCIGKPPWEGDTVGMRKAWLGKFYDTWKTCPAYQCSHIYVVF